MAPASWPLPPIPAAMGLDWRERHQGCAWRPDCGVVVSPSAQVRSSLCLLPPLTPPPPPPPPPVDCGALSDPANGSVVHSSTLVGSSASYTCDEGFVISEVAVRVCTSSREWSGVQPACNGMLMTSNNISVATNNTCLVL